MGKVYLIVLISSIIYLAPLLLISVFLVNIY